MKAYRVRKYKSVAICSLYQSKNFLIRWYFNKRHDVALKMSGISKNDVVFEIGTGEGFLIPSCALRAKKVYACDLINNFIETPNIHKWAWGTTMLYQAKKLLTAELGENKNVLFFYATATSLPFKSESMDIVFMMDCLEHIAPYPQNKIAVSEAYRVLKRGGGVLIVTIPNEKGFMLLLRQIVRKIFRIKARPYQYPIKELIKACIYNKPIGKWSGSHKGYDYSCDVRMIKNVFDTVKVSYVPLTLLFALNPTVIVKAKKELK